MMRQVAEEYYPDCKKIIIESDNLSTHSKSAFYEIFKPSVLPSGSHKNMRCIIPQTWKLVKHGRNGASFAKHTMFWQSPYKFS